MRHAADDLPDHVQIGLGLGRSLPLQQGPCVVRQRPQGGERLVELVGDAGRHLAQRRQRAGMDELVLRGQQSPGAFGHFLFKLDIGALQSLFDGKFEPECLAPLPE